MITNWNEHANFVAWVLKNQDEIVEAYVNSDPVVPEWVYECTCDDDYTDRFDVWAEDLRLDDLPEGWIEGYYEGATGRVLAEVCLYVTDE